MSHKIYLSVIFGVKPRSIAELEEFLKNDETARENTIIPILGNARERKALIPE